WAFDEASALGHAMRSGREEGLKKSWKESWEEGRKESLNEVAQKMRKSGMTEEQIQNILNL
ncbi:MAG: hypothetical protein HDT48_02335, partial [Ruminococcaceae bacterium]|nr:hypothetical protein [Oscillospiraceae bacterium]